MTALDHDPPPGIIAPLVKTQDPTPIAAETRSAAGARLRVVLGAALFSTGGTAIKASAFEGFQVAGLRAAFAFLALLILVPSSRTVGTWRTWLVGLAYGVTALLFVEGNKLTTAANTTFLQATSPLYILLLGPLFLGERVRRGDIGYLVAIGAGMALFFVGIESPTGTAPDPLLGNVLAAISGVTWALTIVGMRWLGRREAEGGPSVASAIVAGNLAVVLASLPWTLSAGSGRPADWLLMAYLGVFQIGLAYIFITVAMGRVRALEASLLLMAEPVLNPFWAFLAHGELPGFWSNAGGAVILIATAVRTFRGVRGGTEPSGGS